MSSRNSQKQRPKLVVLQTHPIQYFAPVYRTLAQRDRIELKVLYLTDASAKAHYDPGFGQQVAWDIPLLEGYDYRILKPGIAIADTTVWQRHSRDLRRILAEERPAWILLYGYACRMNWHALAWARKHGVHLAYTSDSNLRLMRPDWRVVAKYTLVRWFFQKIDAFFSPSATNIEYLRVFGAQTAKIHWCPLAIDFERFKRARPPKAEDRVNFVWAGKLIGLKRPIDFIKALNEIVRRGHQQVTSLMIGSGPTLDDVYQTADTLLPKNMVDFAGFVNQTAMPDALRRGSIFVFTSEHDSYGLGVTEAAACGLALIVADINGCVGGKASAQPGINALIYPVGDVKALADCMEALLTDPIRLKAMQDASIAIAAEHDVSRAAAIIESVVTGVHADHA